MPIQLTGGVTSFVVDGKLNQCKTTYRELCSILKENPHDKALAAQSAQQALKTVAESITSYNSLVPLYYNGEVSRPSLPKYRKKGGMASVTFPRQALKVIPSDRKRCSGRLLAS